MFGSDGTLELDLARGYLTHSEKTRWPEFWDIRVNALHNAKRLKQQGGATARHYLSALLGFRPRSDSFYQSMRGSPRRAKGHLSRTPALGDHGLEP